jgi:hypothetical protein
MSKEMYIKALANICNTLSSGIIAAMTIMLLFDVVLPTAWILLLSISSMFLGSASFNMYLALTPYKTGELVAKTNSHVMICMVLFLVVKILT